MCGQKGQDRRCPVSGPGQKMGETGVQRTGVKECGALESLKDLQVGWNILEKERR